MRRYLLGALAGMILTGCATVTVAATADDNTPSTKIKCEGYSSGNCGKVFWVEREGVHCAVPFDTSGGLSGISCDWREDR